MSADGSEPRCVEGCTRLVAMLLPEVLRISRLPSGEAVAGEIGTPADVAEITHLQASRRWASEFGLRLTRSELAAGAVGAVERELRRLIRLGIV
jgi:hypothetical protein